MALNPPLLKLYDCANFILYDINELAKGQGYAALQVARMVVEVKMPLQMACQVLAAIFQRLTAVMGPYPFRTILLRGPLVHSSFNLNSTSCTILYAAEKGAIITCGSLVPPNDYFDLSL